MQAPRSARVGISYSTSLKGRTAQLAGSTSVLEQEEEEPDGFVFRYPACK